MPHRSGNTDQPVVKEPPKNRGRRSHTFDLDRRVVDFGYGAKVPRPSTRVSRKKCSPGHGVGRKPADAGTREADFGCSVFGDCVERSVGEPVIASSGDRRARTNEKHQGTNSYVCPNAPESFIFILAQGKRSWNSSRVTHSL